MSSKAVQAVGYSLMFGVAVAAFITLEVIGPAPEHASKQEAAPTPVTPPEHLSTPPIVHHDQA